jgi:S-adenosyl-L-methionine hydrolase (adenosine-forming)
MNERTGKIITLTTDFGLDNWFVGTMKGVIKSINPDAEIVDITHGVRRYNFREGAFALLNSYRYFPAGTVHLAVIDPEVGTTRRAIAVRSKRYYFVAPDNGVLSYSLNQEEDIRIVSIENPRYMLEQISTTFHGRDIFAPAAAHLSLGVEINEFGPTITDPVMFGKSVPAKIGERELIGHIVYIDHFGNCITDIAEKHIEDISDKGVASRIKIKIRDREIRRLSSTYSDGKENELICLFGSSGYLEFSVNRGNANKQFTIEEGGEFILKVL